MRDLEEYQKESVRIEAFAIEEEFIRMPADLAYWNEQYATAYGAWRTKQLAVEIESANLAIIVRTELESRGKGRVTLAEVDQVISTTEAWRDLKQAEINAEAEKIRLYGIVDAIRAKKEMLISLGAHMRFEMGNDPTIGRMRAVEKEVEANRK